MKKGSTNILIGGPAGAGIEKSGRTLTLSFVRGGYHVFANVEHMSQIRGGNNFLRIRVDEKEVSSHVEEIDIMIALDKQTIEEHLEEVVDGGVVIFDNEVVKLEEEFIAECEKKGVKMLNVPLKKLATEIGNPIMANVISLGLTCGLVDFDISVLKNTLGKIFAKKGAEVVAMNEKAADTGFKMAKEKWSGDFPVTVERKDPLNKMFITGNELAAMGGVKAGVKYVGEYPMTPSSTVLHFMARWAEKFGIVVKQTEDEISACNSIIGAGFAGVRSLAATSGGGLALMGEAIGLAGMNEVPCVIINVMRPGPATGLPTRGDQGDLRQVMHAGQGDLAKIVLLPSDPEECFKMGFEAHNIAEKYQVPVIVCYDRHLGESFHTVAPFENGEMKVDRGEMLSEEKLAEIEDYKRYLRTDNGVSPRSVPGLEGGIHRATSDEHDEYGDITEDAENRRLMVEKRAKKLEAAVEDLFEPVLIGDEDAEVTLVTWGGTKGICLEAAEILRGEGKSANVLVVRTAYPFFGKQVREMLKKCQRAVVVEHNYDAQMQGLIAEYSGVRVMDTVLRYDGRPMTAKYIIDRI